MPQGAFFKLFPSARDAVVLGALRAHTKEAVQAAHSETAWWIFEIHPTDKQWLDMWQATGPVMSGRTIGQYGLCIQWGPKYDHWQVFGTLNLGTMRGKMEKRPLEAVGLDTWARLAFRGPKTKRHLRNV